VISRTPGAVAEPGRDLGLLFDAIAEDYAAVRPRYPDTLFDDLAETTGLSPGAAVLEIGCGPGIATGPLLARGWTVLAIEPGAAMATIARRQNGGWPLRVALARFEDWEPIHQQFALVFSATAFHWIDPAVRWTKTASVLDDSGHLALATNRTVDGGTFAELYSASRELHLAHAPGMADDGPSPSEAALRADLAAAGSDIGFLWGVADPKGGSAPAGPLFERPALYTYLWEQPYPTTEAVTLLATYSPYLALPVQRRTALLDGIAQLIDERFGGTVTRRYLSVLAVARRS
jgi:SAM-dependent methyltransferase